uniref:CUE domain-containing protein n=1 Tax=Anopheles atroparvus TaxID=41427 RepID=A0A182JD78_ANOAO
MANKAPTKMRDNQPLNKQKLTVVENNVKIPVAALHANWKDPRFFTKYTCFTVDLEGNIKLENYNQWRNETTWFIKDMKHLLGLEYHIFWSTIVHNPSALESVLSFVQNAVPMYLMPELDSLEKQQTFSLYLDVRAYVFRVICRFTVVKENPDSWVETEYLATLLYKHFIVTVPFMLDIIAIYGRDNQHEVSRIVELILDIQPKYQQDFRQGLSYLISVFTVIQNRCESELLEGITEAAQKDLALYAHDCAYTLNVMVEISPTLRRMCADMSCEFAISNFYDNAVLVLYKKIQEVNEKSIYLGLLNDTRVELLEAFRSIVTIQLDKILSGSGDSLLAADKFISILTECLANNVFVSDYKRRYDTEEDLQIVHSGYKSVDRVKFDFIRKAYSTVEHNAVEQREQSDKQLVEFEAGTSVGTPQIVHDSDETTDNVSEQQKQHNLQTIMDLLPHLDIDLVRTVVDRYDNVEEAISVLLEQTHSVEDQLTGQVESEVSIPNDPLDEFYLKTGIDRLNIYDGDEFDVMVNDKVKGTIKKGKGKPGEPKTLNELLDDKSHVRQMRHIYRQFDMIADFDPDDDEYDDSFEAMTESESRHVKLAKGARNELVDDGLDEDSDGENEGETVEPDANPNTALSFCENPEIARKRYEEKLHSKYLRRHGTVAPSAKNGQSGDVRGKPKGQGQDAKVLQNRKNKNENKSSVANHNRKQGATYKRNRGMMPS